MNYEREIKEKTGAKTVLEFARILGAPVRTFYAYCREGKTGRAPRPWQWGAYLDAAKYRSLSVEGWKCKGCGAVIEAGKNDGRKPPFCGGCGSKYFSPVKVVHEPGIKNVESQSAGSVEIIMAYHSPVGFIEKFRYGRSRLPQSCIRCGRVIQPTKKRVKLKKNPSFCFHKECFEAEYDIKFETQNEPSEPTLD